MGCLQDVVRKYPAKSYEPYWIRPRRCIWLHTFAVISAVVLGLDFIGGASAAGISCSQEKYLLTTQAELDELSRCVNVTGSIVFENSTLPSIALNGLQKVDGSLKIQASPALKEISAPELYWINNNFTLSDLPLLSNLSLPGLGTVVEGLQWIGLPSLVRPTLRTDQQDPFGHTGTEIYGGIIVSNTGIESLDFFHFATLAKADNIRISDNLNMNKVNFSSLEKTYSLTIRNNGPAVQVVLPALTRVDGGLQLSNVASADMEKLSHIDGGLKLDGNSFRNFSAPAFTKLGGNMQVLNNPSLESIDLPLLKGIGGGLENGTFTVSNNSALHSLSLPSLEDVDGNVTLHGFFSSISLPLLQDFSSGFHVNTTLPPDASIQNFNCSPFDRIFYSSRFAHDLTLYSCYGYAHGGTLDTANHETPEEDDDSSDLPHGALSIITIIVVVTALLVTGGLLRHFRLKAMAQEEQVPPVALRGLSVSRRHSEDEDGPDGLPRYSRYGKPGEVPPAYKLRSNSNPPPPSPLARVQMPQQVPPVSDTQNGPAVTWGRLRQFLFAGRGNGSSGGAAPSSS